MAYDYKHEYLQWLKEKQLEEKLLRELHFDEEKIKELFIYDKNIFNKNRRFHR